MPDPLTARQSFFSALWDRTLSLPPHRLIALMAGLGLLLAAQIQLIQNSWINNDSVLYLETARLMALGNWPQGYAMYRWPLYPALIAGVHMLSGLSLHVSAQLLNVFFFGIATAAFLKLIHLAGGKNRTLVWGALILFSSQYLVGDVLEMLLRDAGFWAFFVTGLAFFLRYCQSHSWPTAIAWQISMMIAMLFRIEGITFLAALPLALLLQKDYPWRKRFYLLLKAASVNILFLALLALYASHEGRSIAQLGRLSEVFTTNLFKSLTAKFNHHADIMANRVLGEYLDQFAKPALLLTFLMVMVTKTITATGLIGTVLAGYALSLRRQLFTRETQLVLFSVATIALVDMFLIITKVFVLSGRYVIPLTWVLLVMAAFGLERLVTQFAPSTLPAQVTAPRRPSSAGRWLVIGVIVVLCLGLVRNIFPKQDGYNYEQDAIAWLKTNNPDQKTVFYDTARLRHYAGESFVGRGQDTWKLLMNEIASGRIDSYAFLVVSLKHHETAKRQVLREKLPQFELAFERSNANKDKLVLVFRKISETPPSKP